MPGKKKQKPNKRKVPQGGNTSKVVEIKSVQNCAAGDFEEEAPEEDCVADKLNQAQILDDSTEVVILPSSHNDLKNNNDSKVSSMLTLDSGFVDQDLLILAEMTSVQKAEGSFSEADKADKADKDKGSDINGPGGTRDPFEVSYFGAINNNASSSSSVPKDKDKKLRTPASSGRKETTSVAPEGNLKTIEDYIDLGVDPVHATMKHPLENAWTFWYFMGDEFKRLMSSPGRSDTEAWNMCTKNLSTVDTIEDFWQVFNYIERPSRINIDCDYCFFKKGIHPDWADFQNKYGGRWVIEWKEQDLRCKDDVDSHWMEILFILIGEHGDPYNDIVNGAVIQVKKNKFRIGVWLKVYKNEAAVRHIGKLVKERLGLRFNIPFQVHGEEQNSTSKRGSKNMARITV